MTRQMEIEKTDPTAPTRLDEVDMALRSSREHIRYLMDNPVSAEELHVRLYEIEIRLQSIRALLTRW